MMFRRFSAGVVRRGSSRLSAGSLRRPSFEKEEEELKEELTPREVLEERAAQKIQSRWRTALEPKILTIARRVYELAYDADSGRYFYYNRNLSESQWEKPNILGRDMPYRTDSVAIKSAILVQTALRCKMARALVKNRVKQVYQVEYDPETKEMYYLDRRTNAVRWEAPAQTLPTVYRTDKAKSTSMNGDSALLYARDKQIENLRKQLEEKEKEIDAVRQGRYEELGQQVRVRRVAQALKGQKRSRHIEHWRNEQVVAWFMDMELAQYVPNLIQSKVNGLLLLNMDEDDFRELGIIKRLHLRQIDLALRKYRKRYELDHAIEDYDDDDGIDDDDDDLLADENDEDITFDQGSDAMSKAKDDDSDIDELARNDDNLPTEDEVLELQKDRTNIQIDVVFPGDETLYPDIGDIVRCHYVCKLAQNGQEIENTRKNKLPFEFVLGIGQVILGLDRGVLQMSLGERSHIRISALYAYGIKGALPIVPPNADLIFDVELLRWRRRKPWFKPLIQEAHFSQRPYEDESDPDDDQNKIK